MKVDDQLAFMMTKVVRVKVQVEKDIRVVKSEQMKSAAAMLLRGN